MVEQKKKELLSLTNNYVFLRILGEKNLSALAEFLAAVFDITTDEIGELTVDDPHIHRERKEGKSNILDIRVHTSSGEIINVEVQVNPERGFRERIAFLNSKAFSGQLDKGQKYWALNRTVTIVIADFILIKENSDVFNRFRWYNINDRTLLTDTQEIDVLELPKLPREDDGSRLWKWLRFFKSGREEEMEELAKDSEGMKKVMITLREMSADEYERRLAEQREKDEWDRIAQIEYGRMEGEAQGRAEAKKDTARRMKEKGFSEEEIIDITGVKEEDIAKL